MPKKERLQDLSHRPHITSASHSLSSAWHHNHTLQQRVSFSLINISPYSSDHLFGDAIV
jgi:hypothetical protein